MLADERQWFEIYNFIEFAVSSEPTYATDHARHDMLEGFNDVLAEENAGYRFLQGVLAPITNHEELAAINDAANVPDGRFEGARIHIATAVEQLSKRPDPDYRNAIKESISAVESVVRVVAEDPAGGIKNALDSLNARTPIHPALRTGNTLASYRKPAIRFSSRTL